jgi:prepilin-type N-terminal cleavage/methylation domain-containing protein
MKKGFTLVEIMVAVSIFMIVMTISMGSVVSIFDVNRKSHSLKTIMSNLNLSLESMSREMRFGKNYHCCTDGSCNEVLTTSLSCVAGSSGMSFLSSSNLQVVYRQTGGIIEKSIDGGSTYIPITSPEVVIDDLNFYVMGTGGLPNLLQPRTHIKVMGHVGDMNNGGSAFTIQTTISQRALDL